MDAPRRGWNPEEVDREPPGGSPGGHSSWRPYDARVRHGRPVGPRRPGCVALRLDPDGALRAWLTAWSYGLSLALGALCMVMIAYVTGARWFVVVRRVAETMAISVVRARPGRHPPPAGDEAPLSVGPPAGDAPAPHAGGGGEDRGVARPRVLHRPLDPLPGGVDRPRRHVSGAGRWRRTTATPRRRGGSQRPGAPGEAERPRTHPLRASRLTFAAFDWLMSLTPDWYSTIFGVY